MSGNTNISKKFRPFINPKVDESNDLVIKYQIKD